MPRLHVHLTPHPSHPHLSDRPHSAPNIVQRHPFMRPSLSDNRTQQCGSVCQSDDIFVSLPPLHTSVGTQTHACSLVLSPHHDGRLIEPLVYRRLEATWEPQHFGNSHVLAHHMLRIALPPARLWLSYVTSFFSVVMRCH